MVNLIECTNQHIIYGKDTEEGDVTIHFLEYTEKPDNYVSLNMVHYRDFKNGYRNLTHFEKKIYGNFIFSRIGGVIYKIDILNKCYEVIDYDFSGICFMENYILIVKEENNSEKFYKLIPSTCNIIPFNFCA